MRISEDFVAPLPSNKSTLRRHAVMSRFRADPLKLSAIGLGSGACGEAKNLVKPELRSRK